MSPYAHRLSSQKFEARKPKKRGLFTDLFAPKPKGKRRKGTAK